MSRFVPIDRETAYLLPPSVDEWLPKDHLARFVVEVIEQLDLSDLLHQYAGRGWAAHHPAVLLGLLFLRGPQTLNELLTRSSRMHDFEDTEQVQHQLERLIARDLALLVPRQSGQREDRYMHALGDPADIETIMASRQQHAERSSGSMVSLERFEALEARIAALEARLAELE